MNPYGLIADIHAHPWSAFAQTTEDGQNSRLVGLLNEIERCAEEVRAAGGSTIVIAGDLFHVRGSVAPSVFNAVRDKLHGLSKKYNVIFLIIPGNHDLEGKESTRLSSAVTGLEESSSVRVINEAAVMPGAILVPWIENVDDLKAKLETLPTSGGEYDLILHAPIDGVIEGLPAHGLTPEFLAGLGFKRVFAGHYHNHKRFAGEVYSIGALAHHTWSDVGSKAGFLIVHSDRVDWRKSHLPEFIDLEKLEITGEDDLQLAVDRNYVRVKIEADKMKEVERVRKELLDMGALGVVVQSVPKPPERDETTRATVESGASLEVSIADYVRGMGGTAEDSDAITKAALDVLTTVDAMGE